MLEKPRTAINTLIALTSQAPGASTAIFGNQFVFLAIPSLLIIYQKIEYQLTNMLRNYKT